MNYIRTVTSTNKYKYKYKSHRNTFSVITFFLNPKSKKCCYTCYENFNTHLVLPNVKHLVMIKSAMIFNFVGVTFWPIFWHNLTLFVFLYPIYLRFCQIGFSNLYNSVYILQINSSTYLVYYISKLFPLKKLLNY